jgi:hypothetical protein
VKDVVGCTARDRTSNARPLNRLPRFAKESNRKKIQKQKSVDCFWTFILDVCVRDMVIGRNTYLNKKNCYLSKFGIMFINVAVGK